MTMAITMRMVARIFVFATDVTQRPLSSVHYTLYACAHKTHTKSHVAQSAVDLKIQPQCPHVILWSGIKYRQNLIIFLIVRNYSKVSYKVEQFLQTNQNEARPFDIPSTVAALTHPQRAFAVFDWCARNKSRSRT
jgi:hypothetical protein